MKMGSITDARFCVVQINLGSFENYLQFEMIVGSVLNFCWKISNLGVLTMRPIFKTIIHAKHALTKWVKFC